jgi:ubiquinone/menaquinone biosynthesis C-methylase UbiE
MTVIKKLYEIRFEYDLLRRKKLWSILCKSFFQNYINKDWTVLDLGAGFCEFINNIEAKRKYAIDLNIDIQNYADDDIKTFILDAKNINIIESNSIDCVFTSNFFEHLNNKTEVLLVLKEIYRVLKNEGKILMLFPNIKYCYKEYWDFFDHNIPLSHLSLEEALKLSGFNIKKIIPRFLPFSSKNHLPKNYFFFKLYLSIPLFWRLFGKQSFIEAEKNDQ